MEAQLVSILKANPGAHIEYTDNGSWSIYSKADYQQWEQAVAAAEAAGGTSENDPPLVALIEGNDFDATDGYTPPLVAALAELLEMTVSSI